MCRRPYYVKEQGIYAPCGQCEYCLNRRIQDWTLRMMHQYEKSGSASFITLTYRNEDLPPHFSLRKKDLQKYFKRVRKHLENTKIKYYACGEYGSETKRPHYHCIMFGITPQEYKTLDEKWNVWPYGHTFLGATVEAECCAYTAKYVTKIIRSKDHNYAPRERPFQLQSQGLGKEWCDANADEIKKNSILNRMATRKEYPDITKKELELSRKTFIQMGLFSEI